MKSHPVALLDACVLVPMPLADLLLRLAEPPPLFKVRWSEDILLEVTRTLEVRFGKAPEKARYRESAMREFFPDALVHNYRRLIPTLLNHPKDRHVLAAALVCKADYLVTFNIKDFPQSAVRSLPTRVIGPSAFLKQIFTLHPDVVTVRLKEQARAIGISTEDLLINLMKSIPAFVETFRHP